MRRAVELGVDLIDTAWFYGPHVANRFIAETLRPYPKHLVIATKLGSRRTPDKGWAPFARPEELREGVEHDLRWQASATAQNLSAWPRALRSASKLTFPDGSTRRLMAWTWPTSSRSRGSIKSRRCSRILKSVAQRPSTRW